MKLVAQSDSQVVEICQDLRVADTAWTRFWGLMGQSRLPEEAGLWIRPCNSIHTFFMRFAIDVLFVSKENKIVDVVSSVRPYRMTWPRFKSHSVVELPSGVIASKGLRVGMELTFA